MIGWMQILRWNCEHLGMNFVHPCGIQLIHGMVILKSLVKDKLDGKKTV
jgi:hypothetical protein